MYSGCWFSIKFKFEDGGTIATCVQSMQPIIPGNPVWVYNLKISTIIKKKKLR